tara:strand:- start:704 stop:1042 length:339 start_codon:yes stop_codon:yes gene_type:complete
MFIKRGNIMQISGEVDITIDQYADFEIDLDVDRLAEELATDHNFVHVEEYCDSYVADRVSERVEEELAERDSWAKDPSTGLTPTEFTTLVQSIVREEINYALEAAVKRYPSA